jgi:hypothetical protein
MYYFVKELVEQKDFANEILLAQIKEFRPDVLWIFDFHYFTPKFLKLARTYVQKIIGYIYAPIFVPKDFLRSYDILFSPFPHYVERFRASGIPSAYLPFAFESSILKQIRTRQRVYNCVYIGGLSKGVDKVHFLEKAAEKINIDFWGYGNPPLDQSSPIFKSYHGQAWGIDLYKILAQSKIVVNRHTELHGNFSSKYADNVRLYESTGMGCFLITDWKENLGELFEIGKEVETYNSLDELVEKIQYYSTHDAKREKIAKAGQARTLRDHTYEQRAKRILEILC